MTIKIFVIKNKKTTINKILKSYYNITNVKIVNNKFGKPYLKNKQLYFNFSHSKNLLACAVSKNDVGFDLQHPKRQLISAKAAFLTTKEIQTYKKATINQLAKIWAFKEAVVKLLGVGLTKRLNTFTYSRNLIINRKRVYVRTGVISKVPFAVASHTPLIVKLINY